MAGSELLFGGGLFFVYLLFLVVGIIDLVFRIWGVVSILSGNKDFGKKVIWILVLAFIPFGGFIWFFVDR